jgi:hypothetical protein
MSASNLAQYCRNAWLTSRLPFDDLALRARLAWPGVFGVPVAGPMAQLYRADDELETVVSLPNSLSYFLLQEQFTTRYRIVAYDRHGRRIAAGSQDVGARATAHQRLRDLVDGGRLDSFGIFTVQAKYDRSAAPRLAFLRQTAPQFMTLFVGSGAAAGIQAPQILHSHKRLRLSPTRRRPVATASQSLEQLGALESLSAFVPNTCPSPLAITLTVTRAGDGEVVWKQAAEVAGWAVHRFELRPSEVSASGEEFYALRFDFDRYTGHRRPILFRRFPNGLVTSNHS